MTPAPARRRDPLFHRGHLNSLSRQIFRAMGLGLLGTVATRWRGFRELVRQVQMMACSEIAKVGAESQRFFVFELALCMHET